MLLVYPSILLPPPDVEVDPQIKTLVGIKGQLKKWPTSILEPGACNNITVTIKAIMESHGGSRRIVPLVEKVVLACGLASQRLQLKRSFSLESAINCTDRFRQRLALEPTGLNPRWYKDSTGDLSYPFVVKRPASARSGGVALIKNRGELVKFTKNTEKSVQEIRLDNIGATPNYRFITEEYIEGENWEVTGISREKVAHIFPPIRQVWDPPIKWIDEYRAEKPPHDLINTAIKAVESMGLKWCTWCIEIKGYENRWKVMEVNGRLGEDGRGYYKMLGNTEVANKVCETLI